MEWIYIDDFKLRDDSKFISCDTRDFYMTRTMTDPRYGKELGKWDSNLLKTIEELSKNPPMIEKYIRDYDDIIKYLKSIENKTGGKGDWRFLSFNCNKDVWCKYIRAVKYNDHKWFIFTEDCNDIIPIDIDEYSVGNIIEDTLYFDK